MRMNRKKEFEKVINFYLVIKYCPEDSKEYKSALEVLKAGSIYTCCSCGNKSGLSFLEPKHSCKNPMYNKKHIPFEKYMKLRCEEYGWNWEKVNIHFKKVLGVRGLLTSSAPNTEAEDEN